MGPSVPHPRRQRRRLTSDRSPERGCDMGKGWEHIMTTPLPGDSGSRQSVLPVCSPRKEGTRAPHSTHPHLVPSPLSYPGNCWLHLGNNFGLGQVGRGQPDPLVQHPGLQVTACRFGFGVLGC